MALTDLASAPICEPWPCWSSELRKAIKSIGSPDLHDTCMWHFAQRANSWFSAKANLGPVITLGQQYVCYLP